MILAKILCFFGMHNFVFRPNLSVPYYGTGHDQCHRCDLVRVEPCGDGDDLYRHRFDDPLDDPAVRGMLFEVIRTGRPMQMNRGEAPNFADED